MPFIRHKQRAITSLSPVKGQGRWINPSKGKSAYQKLEEDAQNIKDNAGVPANITPGPLLTPGLTGATVQATGPALIVDEAGAQAWSDEGNGGGGVIGGGQTADDPYIIQSLDWTNTAGIPFDWADSDATYYIRLVNCQMLDNIGTFTTAIVRSDTATQLELVNCELAKTGGSGVPNLLITSGDLVCRETLFPAQVNLVLNKQTTGNCDFYNCTWDSSVSNWGGGQVLFQNNAIGGRINQTHCSFGWTGGSTKAYFGFVFDCAVLVEGCLISSKVNADAAQGLGIFISGNAPYANAGTSLISPKIFRNSSIFAGINSMFEGSQAATEEMSNFIIHHCDLYHTPIAQRMISIGRTPAEVPLLAKNNVITWCKMEKTDDGGIPNGAPGNELCEVFGASDSEMGWNYVVRCPEDAMEFHEPHSNNVIHDIVSENCRGQVADFFKSVAGWSQIGNRAYSIFGICKGEAVVNKDIDGVAWKDILCQFDAGVPRPNSDPVVDGGALVWMQNAAAPDTDPANCAGTGFLTEAADTTPLPPYKSDAIPDTNTNNTTPAPAIIPT